MHRVGGCVLMGGAKMGLGIHVKREDKPLNFIKFHVCVMCVGGRNTSQGQDKTRSHRSPHVHNNVRKCFYSPQVDGNCASCDASGHLKTIRCVHAQVSDLHRSQKNRRQKKTSSEVQLGANQVRRRQEHNLAGDTVDQHLH